jgi:hypothetical protein
MDTLTNAHALVIGIADYAHARKLPATRDAAEIAALLVDPAFCGYPVENVARIEDGAATGAAIRQGLADLATRADKDSTVFLFFSGHGGRVDAGPHAGEYLVPVDGDPASDATIAATCISGAEFSAALAAVPARRVVIVFDCCHAAGVGDLKDLTSAGDALAPGLSQGYYRALATGGGRVVFASSKDAEPSWVMAGDSYGLFTKHLLAGLRGGAPGPGGVIRVFDLFNYVQPRVTKEQPNQHPIFKAEIEENFPIALHLAGEVVPVPASAPLADGFAYDVFLSYRQQEPDKTWVRKVLRPRLEADGLRVCIDHRDFRLGAPLVLEMARAVEESRYTLSVLTPAYLDSNFTELESVLAEHLGVERSERRLLAVLREPCEPRLGMRARLWLDMTDDDEFEMNVARLVYEIRQAPEK